jgi:hypothetical protein
MFHRYLLPPLSSVGYSEDGSSTVLRTNYAAWHARRQYSSQLEESIPRPRCEAGTSAICCGTARWTVEGRDPAGRWNVQLGREVVRMGSAWNCRQSVDQVTCRVLFLVRIWIKIHLHYSLYAKFCVQSKELALQPAVNLSILGEVYSSFSYTSALDGCMWLAPCPGRKERTPSTQLDGNVGGPQIRPADGGKKNLCPRRKSNLGRPSHSYSLCWWNYPAVRVITPCIPLEVKWRFGGTCRVYLQGGRVNEARNQYEVDSRQFLRNVSLISTGCMAIYPTG